MPEFEVSSLVVVVPVFEEVPVPGEVLELGALDELGVELLLVVGGDLILSPEKDFIYIVAIR